VCACVLIEMMKLLSLSN